MYVARRESIKKNNKLSKVDWGITMSSTKNDISLKKLILKLSSDGVGILITDHYVRDTLLITNKSYVLSEGKILANGSSSELADNPIVKKYYLGDNFKL